MSATVVQIHRNDALRWHPILQQRAYVLTEARPHIEQQSSAIVRFQPLTHSDRQETDRETHKERRRSESVITE